MMNMSFGTEHTLKENIRPGAAVDIVLKKDQGTENLTHGTVARVLTKSPQHPRGIKVMLTDGQVGRVQHIVEKAPTKGGA